MILLMFGVLSTEHEKEANERSECDRILILGGVVMVERFGDLKLRVEVMRAKVDVLERLISSRVPLIDKDIVEVCEEVINSCIDNIRLSSGLLFEDLEDILKMR